MHLDPPNVTIDLSNIIVNSSSNVTLVCSIFSVPLSSIFWFKEITNSFIENSETTKLNLEINDNYWQVSTLTIFNSTKLDQSNYTCIGVNNITDIINVTNNDTVELLVQGIHSYFIND